jgi:hypothetical protein
MHLLVHNYKSRPLCSVGSCKFLSGVLSSLACVSCVYCKGIVHIRGIRLQRNDRRVLLMRSSESVSICDV